MRRLTSYRRRLLRDRSWFRLLVFCWSVFGCGGCDLGTKLACDVDGDCFDGLSCISGTCYKCAADKAGCACADGSCLHGMVCSAESTCVDCSKTDPCSSGSACDAGRCVGCSPDFVGCPCDAGQCGEGLRCSENNECVPLACGDRVRNGDETDIDCGGSCPPCSEGFRCQLPTDCESLACDKRVCLSIESCHVRTAEFPTIQSAIDDPRCASVVIQPGVIEERVRIHRAIEISGTPSTPAIPVGTVLTSTEPGPVIEITEGAGTVYLRDLEIRDGVAARGGGVAARRDLVVENSRFVGNRASVNADWGRDEDDPIHASGGAIFAQGADLTVRDSTFAENQAEETRFAGERADLSASGGAICMSGIGELLVESSEFRRNLATTTANIPGTSPPLPPPVPASTASGGAISRLDEGSTIIRDSVFVDNMALSVDSDEDEFRTFARGGAIAVPPVEAFFATFEGREPPVRSLIEGSVFDANVAYARWGDAWGGAVYLGGAWIRDTTFEHNWARSFYFDGVAGAAVLRGGGRIESTRFFRNRGDGDGGTGALYTKGPITILNSVFWDNQGASISAARLEDFYDYLRRFSVVNSTFAKNGPGPPILARYPATIRHSVVINGDVPCRFPWYSSGGYNVFDQEGCLVADLAETDRVTGAPLVEVMYDRSNGPRALEYDSADPFSEPGFPLANGPLVDGGDPMGCRDEDDNPITVDSRGVARVGPCDIGAFAVDPEQHVRAPLEAFILTQVTPQTPEFHSPDGSCENNVTQAVAALINESISGDNERPPRFECDGMLDSGLVLILDTEDGRAGFSSLRPAACVATHVACEDPWDPTQTTPFGDVDYRILTTEPCTLTETGFAIEPGADGCIEAEIVNLRFDAAIAFEFSHAALVGELDSARNRISNGLLRGFMPVETSSPRIPYSMWDELGIEVQGAADTQDLLCAAELVERDGEPGYIIELGVELDEVTLFGQGLPPIRPLSCE